MYFCNSGNRQNHVDSVGKTNPRIAYIPSGGNSTDLFYNAQKEYYSQYQIDLSPCFYLGDRYQTELLDSLLSADAIHLSGGNTFHFLHWLRKRNLIRPLKQYVEDAGVLIGVSAGAILMTPDIQTSLLCGDSLPFEKFNTQSLGLVDFAFVPHLGSHANLEDIKVYSRQNSQISVVACPDNGGIVVVDDEIRLVGEVKIYKNGLLVSS